MQKTTNNPKLLKIIMDYASIVNDRALALLSSLQNISVLCGILRDLRQPLKCAYSYSLTRVTADIEMRNLLQCLYKSLQNIQSNVIDKTVNANSATMARIELESVVHFKSFDEEVTKFILFLKRIGVYVPAKQPNVKSPWVCSRASSEAMINSLWPMIFLPDRNMSLFPRCDVISKVCEMMRPSGKPRHMCVVNKAGVGGMGRSETILECTYQCIEEGIYGAVVWLTCCSQASITSSFRYLAQRIARNDPSFMTWESDISSIPAPAIISVVVRWMERLPMPYLLVLDGADDPSLVTSDMIPQSGDGTVVALSLSIHTNQWRTIFKSRPRVIELCPLSGEEGLTIAEKGLCTVGDISKADILELLQHFDYSPSWFASALRTINCMRNRSFCEIGPREYLDRLKEMPSMPEHVSVPSCDSAVARVVLAYQSLVMRLNTAKDMETACDRTIQRLMDLMCFICSDSVDIRILFDWIRPSYMPLCLSDAASMGAVIPATAMRLSISAVEEIASDQDIEFIVTIHSLLPRLIKTSGELMYTWSVYRRYSDIEYFFNTIRDKCSAKMQVVQFPQLSTAYSKKQLEKNINTALTQLCADSMWPMQCDNDTLKKFLNIHQADVSDSQREEKVKRLLEPLVALGIIRIQHRLDMNTNQNGVEDDEDEESSGGCKRVVVTIGVEKSVQDAVQYTLQQEGREKTVSMEIIRFLLGYFGTENNAPREEAWSDEGVSRESLLSHVERAVTLATSELRVCFDLCESAFHFAVEKGIFPTAHVLATRALDILTTLAPSGTSHSGEVATWKQRVAWCCFRMGRLAEASMRYLEALECRQEVSQHPSVDPLIGDIYSEMADVSFAQGNYEVAELSLKSLCEIWQHILEDNPSDEATQLKISVFHERMFEVKCMQNELDNALRHSKCAVDTIIRIRGDQSESVAKLLQRRAKMLMSSDRYNDARVALCEAIGVYETITNKDLVHSRVPSVFVDIAECDFAQAKYSSAEELLLSALETLNALTIQSPSVVHEKAEVYLRLSDVLLEQGNYCAAVEKAKVAYDIMKQLYGVHSNQSTSVLCKIGKIYKSQAKYSETEEILNEVLSLSEKCMCTDSAVEALNALADMYSAQSNHQQAELCLSRALALLRDTQYDGDDGRVVKAIAEQLCALADLKKDRHDFEAARELYDAALEQLRSAPGLHSATIAHVLELLADLFSERGEERAAKRHREESIKIYRRLGESTSENFHVDGENGDRSGQDSNDAPVVVSASALGSIAALLSAENKFDEAVPIHEKAVSLLSSQYGKNHPRIAMALNNLARVLISKGRFAQAQTMHEKALDILRRVHGENHPHVATAMHNLGTLLAQQGKNEDAISLISLALERRRRIFGDFHVFVTESLKVLGHLCYLEGNFAQSRKHLDECLEIRRKLYEGSDSRFCIAVSLNNLGLVLKSMLMHTDAEKALRESLAIRSELYSSENKLHPALAVANNSLGMLLAAMGRYQEARECLNTALSSRKLNYGDIHSSVANTMHSLSDLAAMEGRMGEAVAIMSEVIDMRTSIYGESSEIVIASVDRLASLYRLTGQEIEAEKLELRLRDVCNNSHVPDSHSDALLALMNSFEEDADGATQFLKMEYVAKRNEISNTSSVVLGGPGWPDRLLVKLHTDREALRENIRKQEKELTDKRAAINSFESELKSMHDLLTSKSVKAKELETLTATDKRYGYDLNMLKQQEEELLVRYNEMKASNLSSSLEDISTFEQSYTRSENQLRELNADIASIEIANDNLKECEKNLAILEQSIVEKHKAIEALRWRLIESDGSNETADSETKSALRAYIMEKIDIEVDKEFVEVSHRKIERELEVIRTRFKIPGEQTSSLSRSLQSNAKGIKDQHIVFDVSSDEESVDDDDGDVDDSDDGGKQLRLKKRVKKQRMLIDILTSQVESLGAQPVAEVVTFPKAEQKLQAALMRLMEGDEDAAKDFDKWDQFVRNHPEYKKKEAERREKWERENKPVNEIALRMVRTIVPPSIASACTLVMLEDKLPKSVAKRVWMKKALWLTRMDSSRIARLHIADLQSKYSPQGLDEIELRAVFASLPETFDNDAKGDKAAWKEGVLQSLQTKCKQELPWAPETTDFSQITPSENDIRQFLKTSVRTSCYRDMSDEGPFDPEEESIVPDEVSHKDEAEDYMSNKMDSLAKRENEVTESTSENECTGDKSEELRQPSRSIMRRASVFGAQAKLSKPTSKKAVKNQTPLPSKPEGGMAGLMAEMALKVQKKKEKLNQL